MSAETASSSESFAAELARLANTKPETADLPLFALLLVISLAASLLLAWLYQRLAVERESGSRIYLSFPLLAVAVTSIFVCIQFSLPLSLGLLGALSIVRFRTPIKQPEEVGFLLLVIASSIACATFNLHFLVGLLAVTTLSLLLRRTLPGLFAARSEPASLLLSLSEAAYSNHGEALLALVSGRVAGARLESVATHGGEVTLSFQLPALSPALALPLEREVRALAAPTRWTLLLGPRELP